MTAGLAYEGLNQAGDKFKDRELIVILNDNDMSISRNVGASKPANSQALPWQALFAQNELLSTPPGFSVVWQFWQLASKTSRCPA